MTTTSSGGSALRRIIGIVLLVIGALGVVLGIAGIIFGVSVVDGIGVAVNDTLSMATDILTTTGDTLEQTKVTVSNVQTGLGDVEKTIVDTGETVVQANDLVKQALVITSEDIPDTLDAVNTALPPAAETTKMVLTDLEKAMVDTSKIVGQNGPLVNQALAIASQDVPDTIDYVNAMIPPVAEVTQSMLGNVEATMVGASQTVDQADAAYGQALQLVSQDFPNTLDAVYASVPPAADAAQAMLTNVETVMVGSSEAVKQADALVDQGVRIVSYDVPYMIDVMSANVPPTAEITQIFLDNLGLTLDNVSTNVQQTEAAMDLASVVVSEQVPMAIDQVNAVMPSVIDATEGNVNTTLALLEQLNYLDTGYRVDVDDAATADQVAANLAYLAYQLRVMDQVFDANLNTVDQGVVALSQNVDLMSAQVDQLVASAGYLDQVSDQLRGLEVYSDNNLEAVGEYIFSLSGDVAAINDQVGAFVEVAGQLEEVSDQLRGLEAYADTDLDVVSDGIMALSQDVSAVNQQVDQFVQVTGLVGQLSNQLRALGPYAEIDTATISEDILMLSENVAAINSQIDEFVALTGQLDQLSSQLRSLGPYSDVDFEVIGQDIIKLSEDVALINAQLDEFIVLIDQYVAVVDNLNGTVSQVQANLDQQVGVAKTVVIIAMIWILLAQLTPLYLGWELIRGRRVAVPVTGPAASPPASE